MELSVLLSAFCLLGWMMQAQAQSTPIVIKFSHVATVDSPKGKAADFFCAESRRVDSRAGAGRGLSE